MHDRVAARFAREASVVVHRGASSDVLATFEDGHFDWVYIDGNHSYAFVLNDLRLSLAKTKPGGAIAGDDYSWGETEANSIQRAVDDFVDENGLGERLTIIGSQFAIDLPA